MTFPTEWKVIKFHGSSHHQPEISWCQAHHPSHKPQTWGWCKWHWQNTTFIPLFFYKVEIQHSPCLSAKISAKSENPCISDDALLAACRLATNRFWQLHSLGHCLCRWCENRGVSPQKSPKKSIELRATLLESQFHPIGPVFGAHARGLPLLHLSWMEIAQCDR